MNYTRTIPAGNGAAKLTLRSSSIMDHWLVYFDKTLYLGEAPLGKDSNRVARELFAEWDKDSH